MEFPKQEGAEKIAEKNNGQNFLNLMNTINVEIQKVQQTQVQETWRNLRQMISCSNPVIKRNLKSRTKKHMFHSQEQRKEWQQISCEKQGKREDSRATSFKYWKKKLTT